jgi:hypothetical protein
MTDNNRNTPSWEHDEFVHGWWITPGRFLATEYPGHKDEERAKRKIAVLTAAGVNSFVDLTEAGEPAGGGSRMVPYKGLLPDGVNHRRFPIPDTSVVDDDGYDDILDYIRAELEQGRIVVCHCWGGRGRTGTVVGAWLIDTEGLSYREALARMEELRAGSRKSDRPVPDEPEQYDVLRRRAQRREATR